MSTSFPSLSGQLHAPATIRCPRCSQRMPTEWKRCDQCGTRLHPHVKMSERPSPTPLTQSCSGCGFQNQPAARFCGRCGIALPISETVPVSLDPPQISQPNISREPNQAHVIASKPLSADARGISAASTFAGLLCFLDGVILLVVAFMQISAGGLGLLVGLWNLLVTGAYMYVAFGLLNRASGSCDNGIRLGLTNLALVFFQLRLIALMSSTGFVSEASVTIPLIFIGGDLILVITLFALKNTIEPPPVASEIEIPAGLLTELEQARQAGRISTEESDRLIMAFRGFAANAMASRTCQIQLGNLIGGERIDMLRWRTWDAAMSGHSNDATYTELYLFRAIVDKDVLEWLKQTVWKETPSRVAAVICIFASPRAVATAGYKLFKGNVGLYALRGDVLAKGGCVGEFVKYYRTI